MKFTVYKAIREARGGRMLGLPVFRFLMALSHRTLWTMKGGL